MSKTKKRMITASISIGFFMVGLVLFFQRQTFGANPAEGRLQRIERSPQYKNGSFKNTSPTEVMRKETSTLKVLIDFFNKPKTTVPDRPLPVIKTDLRKLSNQQTSIVWFGHSSYLIHSKGKNILVDPVFSGYASPVSFFGKAFDGTDAYQPEDMPDIDLLIITHDHYDHLDHETLVTLQPKIKKIYTALGVGAHLERWGFTPEQIVEFDWWEKHRVLEDIELIATPARHFSGRSFSRGKTLWTSFVLNLYGYRLFIGGDSGYDDHFKTIGEQYGPFDLALLETGQYGKDWPYIHMMPEETVTAAKDLKAKVLLPVHWGKFALAYHDWREPVQRLMLSATKQELNLSTPMIGEPLILDSLYPKKEWWNF